MMGINESLRRPCVPGVNHRTRCSLVERKCREQLPEHSKGNAPHELTFMLAVSRSVWSTWYWKWVEVN